MFEPVETSIGALLYVQWRQWRDINRRDNERFIQFQGADRGFADDA